MNKESCVNQNPLPVLVADDDAEPLDPSLLDALGVTAERWAFLEDEMPGLIQNCKNGVDRIMRILGSLTIYSRKEGSGIQRCDLNECVKLAVDLWGGPLKRHLTIDVREGQGLPSFRADAQQIEQVFINLFVNASDALQGHRDALLTIRTFTEGKWLCADVEDNRPGIPDDAIDSIWTPFFTTKAVGKGTELGLSICQSVVEGAGGRIRVENLPAGSARFRVFLPVEGR